MTYLEAIPERMSEATRNRWEQKRKRNGERFIRGPIPLTWLKRASCLPGKSLAVGLLCWYLRGFARNEAASLTPSVWNQFGLSRSAVYRALERLESASLITVERHRGRCPVVTIRQQATNRKPPRPMRIADDLGSK